MLSDVETQQSFPGRFVGAAEAICPLLPVYPRGSYVTIEGPQPRGDGKLAHSYRWIPTQDFAEATEKCRGVEHRFVSVEFYYIPRSHRPKKKDATPNGAVLCHLDLDYHKSIHADPTLKHLTPERVTQLVLDRCKSIGIPLPSYVMTSGGGLCAFWLFEKPAWKGAKKRVTQTNLKLVELFKAFGADRDAANKEKQILRVPGSLNAGRLVRVIWLNEGLAWDAIRHDWRKFCDAITPPRRYTEEQIAEFRRRDALRESRSAEKQEKSRWRYRMMRDRKSNVRSLQQERRRRGASARDVDRGQALLIEDLEAIIENEYSGRVPKGLRNLFASRACVAMTHLYDADDVLRGLQLWASRFIDAAFVENELPRTMDDIIRRAHEAEAGGVRLYKDQPVDPRYRYNKETLRTDLKIRPHQDRYLKYLISDAEKQRRNTIAQRKKRRVAGVQERDAYLSERHERRLRAAQLRAAGWTWLQVGEQLGMSAGAARMAAARLDPETREIAENQLSVVLPETNEQRAHTSVSVSTPPLGAATPAGPAQAEPGPSSEQRGRGAGVGARRERHTGGSAGRPVTANQNLDLFPMPATTGVDKGSARAAGSAVSGATGDEESADRSAVNHGSGSAPTPGEAVNGQETLSENENWPAGVSGGAEEKTPLSALQNSAQGPLVPWPQISGAEVVLLRYSSGKRAIAIDGEFDTATAHRLAAEGFRPDGTRWLRFGGTCKLSELKRIFGAVSVVQRLSQDTRLDLSGCG